MGIVFCLNSFIGELFWYSQIYGYDFQKFSRFMGILSRNFSGFMGILLRNFSGFMGGLRFEWHNPVSWKLKLSPPPGIPSKNMFEISPLLHSVGPISHV